MCPTAVVKAAATVPQQLTAKAWPSVICADKVFLIHVCVKLKPVVRSRSDGLRRGNRYRL
jgi:hypothetical protein